MYTHSVISQRSSAWFYFLVKPASLHTASAIPVLAWKVHSDRRTSQAIYSLDAALALLFHLWKSNIYQLASSMFFCDPWKKNPFSLPSLWKTTEAEAAPPSVEWPGKMQQNVQLKIADIMQDRKMTLKQLFYPNWQHVNILNCSEAWQPQIQVEGDTQASSLTYESIYAKFPAYHYGTAWFRLNHLEDLALFKKARDQKVFSTQQGQCIPWSCLLHQWGMAARGKF